MDPENHSAFEALTKKGSKRSTIIEDSDDFAAAGRGAYGCDQSNSSSTPRQSISENGADKKGPKKDSKGPGNFHSSTPKAAEWLAHRMSRVLDGVIPPWFAVDRAGRVTDWSLQMRELAGPAEPNANVKGMRIFDMVATGMAGQERLRTAMAATIVGLLDPVICELRMPWENDPRTVMIRIIPRVQPGGEPIGAFCLAESATACQPPPSVRIDSRSTNLVMNELRSPLHGIMGLSRTLAQAAGPQQNMLRLIENSAEGILENVTNLLDCWALSGYTVDFQFESVDLKELIQKELARCHNAIDKHGNQLKRDGVKILQDLPDSLTIVEADSQWISQLVHHLIMNALRFTLAGHIKAKAALCEEGQAVEISVEDTGIGIARGSLQRVLEPYQQEDSTDSRTYDGIGLGLAICREVAKRHGGHIKLQSEKGKGTCITVVLPCRQSLQSKLTDSFNNRSMPSFTVHMHPGAKSLVMHELRSPLHGIVGVSRSLAQDDSMLKKPLAMISNTAESVLANVTNLLDYWALADGAVEFAFETIDVRELLHNELAKCEKAVDKQGRPLRKKGVEIIPEFDENTGCIEADLQSLSMLAHHLVTNALKFTTKGKVTVVAGPCPEDPLQIELRVEDTGCGVDPSNFDYIFDAYCQEDVSASHGGVGVGLSICREVLRRHRGTITLDSVKGQGSKFTVRLPRKQFNEKHAFAFLSQGGPMLLDGLTGGFGDSTEITTVCFVAVVEVPFQEDEEEGRCSSSSFLARLFTIFGDLAGDYHASSHEMIGSNYILVMEGDSASNPADRMIKLALAMHGAIDKLLADMIPDIPVKFRGGVHANSCTARKHVERSNLCPGCPLFGAGVDAAKRLCDKAKVNQLLLSSGAYERLSDEVDLELEAQGFGFTRHEATVGRSRYSLQFHKAFAAVEEDEDERAPPPAPEAAPVSPQVAEAIAYLARCESLGIRPCETPAPPGPSLRRSQTREVGVQAMATIYTAPTLSDINFARGDCMSRDTLLPCIAEFAELRHDAPLDSGAQPLSPDFRGNIDASFPERSPPCSLGNGSASLLQNNAMGPLQGHVGGYSPLPWPQMPQHLLQQQLQQQQLQQQQLQQQQLQQQLQQQQLQQQQLQQQQQLLQQQQLKQQQPQQQQQHYAPQQQQQHYAPQQQQQHYAPQLQQQHQQQQYHQQQLQPPQNCNQHQLRQLLLCQEMEREIDEYLHRLGSNINVSTTRVLPTEKLCYGLGGAWNDHLGLGGLMGVGTQPPQPRSVLSGLFDDAMPLRPQAGVGSFGGGGAGTPMMPSTPPSFSCLDASQTLGNILPSLGLGGIGGLGLGQGKLPGAGLTGLISGNSFGLDSGFRGLGFGNASPFGANYDLRSGGVSP